MAISDYALVTLADLKVYLGISGTDYDTKLEDLIDSVSFAVENYIGGYGVVRTISTELHDGDSVCEYLQLRHYPISSVTLIEVDSTEVSSTYYTVDKQAGLVKYSGGWSSGEQNIDVDYVAGLYADTASVNDSLKLVCKMWIADLYQNTNPNVKSETLGDYSVAYLQSADGISPKIKMLLDNYKRVSILG